MSQLLYFIDSVQRIAGICPCCGEIFQLAEAKFIFPKKRPPKSKLQEIYSYQRDVGILEENLDRKEANLASYLDNIEVKYQERHKYSLAKGRQNAKKALKKIDPHFSGQGFDPQDVKIIFDPVEFIIFNKLNDSQSSVNQVLFYGSEPKTKRQENILKSIESILKNGHYEFEVLKISKEGKLIVD